MKNLSEIKIILGNYKDKLRNKYGVKELFIFGSYVRNEQKTSSDIDIIVEFYPNSKTFDNHMNLKQFLEEILNIRVDLITRDAIKSRYKKYIYKDLINV